MNYVISKYVYLFASSKNDHLIYCSRSNTFLKTKRDLFEYLKQCQEDSSLINDLDSDLLELLKKNKIIVLGDEDNNFLLEHQFTEDSNCYERSGLGLVLVPTLACNFDCPYCFETGKRACTMSDEIIEHLISFIKMHTEAQSFNITWYGGEPLLAFGKIRKIMERIDSDISIPLRGQSIITNGYLFNSEVINFFKDHPLNSIQITLDGKKERHDNLRKQKITGDGTYDQIIRNIDNILTELPDTKLSIRVNIEKNNIEDFNILNAELSERWKNKNVVLYPGILRIDNEAQTALSCASFNKWEEHELFFDLTTNRIIEDSIFPTLFHNQNCCATRLNAYIIGPRGEIYKCWNDVSDDKKIIGYINEEKLTNPALLYKYIVGSKWYHNNECVNCFFLPICHGNCAWYRLRNQYENGKYNLCQCMQSAPDMLDKCLEHYYDEYKAEKHI